MAKDNVTKQLHDILSQCHDTLEWQVGTGVSVVDFLFPKIKYALTLLQEPDENYRERTTADELRTYVSTTFDFVDAETEDEQ